MYSSDEREREREKVREREREREEKREIHSMTQAHVKYPRLSAP